ncbi:hypothetical protein [Lentzea sp. NPDC004782]|uniref:hypothetical protein n=1 Tax=Lentzea sp. NPDC004782 TaxID=3154458 RepID=UPI0033A33614
MSEPGAPKGLDNRITGNTTTQIFGKLGSPAQIRAAEDLARARGSAVPDIARLSRGEFFVATDATGFHLTTVPMCLSHHPPSPPLSGQFLANKATFSHVRAKRTYVLTLGRARGHALEDPPPRA